MHLDPSRLADSALILLGIYWVYTSIAVKPVARREPPISRALRVAVMLVASWLLFSSHASVGLLAYPFVPASPWIGWTGFALTAAGCGFAAWGRAFLGTNWSAAVTLKQHHELVRTGPYAVVRHPMYAGLLLAVFGVALEVRELRALVAVAIAFVVWLQKIRREEQFLLHQFAGDYVRYSRSVKRLIPFIL
jgi:protein-S-isoprenylcysteine O-methyltransferase Ste14